MYSFHSSIRRKLLLKTPFNSTLTRVLNLRDILTVCYRIWGLNCGGKRRFKIEFVLLVLKNQERLYFNLNFKLGFCFPVENWSLFFLLGCQNASRKRTSFLWMNHEIEFISIKISKKDIFLIPLFFSKSLKTNKFHLYS